MKKTRKALLKALEPYFEGIWAGKTVSETTEELAVLWQLSGQTVSAEKIFKAAFDLKQWSICETTITYLSEDEIGYKLAKRIATECPQILKGQLKLIRITAAEHQHLLGSKIERIEFLLSRKAWIHFAGDAELFQSPECFPYYLELFSVTPLLHLYDQSELTRQLDVYLKDPSQFNFVIPEHHITRILNKGERASDELKTLVVEHLYPTAIPLSVVLKYPGLYSKIPKTPASQLMLTESVLTNIFNHSIRGRFPHTLETKLLQALTTISKPLPPSLIEEALNERGVFINAPLYLYLTVDKAPRDLLDGLIDLMRDSEPRWTRLFSAAQYLDPIEIFEDRMPYFRWFFPYKMQENPVDNELEFVREAIISSWQKSRITTASTLELLVSIDTKKPMKVLERNVATMAHINDLKIKPKSTHLNTAIRKNLAPAALELYEVLKDTVNLDDILYLGLKQQAKDIIAAFKPKLTATQLDKVKQIEKFLQAAE